MDLQPKPHAVRTGSISLVLPAAPPSLLRRCQLPPELIEGIFVGLSRVLRRIQLSPELIEGALRDIFVGLSSMVLP